MPTERLHLTDSLLLDFDARVLAVSEFGGAPSLVLDRTAFYAEAGGQLGDHGFLRIGGNSIAVHDVQADDAGVVHHLVESIADVAVDSAIHGSIDERRRRDFMSQHTGQHMLSRAFLDARGHVTVSARLGSDDSTIDLDVGSLDRDAVAKVAQRVNDAVLEDRPVRVLFPTADELPALKLSKAPTVTRDIRVIVVDGFDAMPCGGTHCQRTGQVGPVVVTGWEKYKGKTRLSFLAGQRAIEHFLKTDALVRNVTGLLTCTAAELTGVVSRMKDEEAKRAEALGHLRAELARRLARELLDQNPPSASGATWIRYEWTGADIDALRVCSAALCERPDVIAVVSAVPPDSADRIFVAHRGTDVDVDVGKWVKSVTTANGGRGGGRPEHAEGRVPASVDWPAITKP